MWVLEPREHAAFRAIWRSWADEGLSDLEGGDRMIDATLARRLVASQFPQWADLPVTGVADDGWDNRTFRLGSELTVRLPTGEWYAHQVAKEQRWPRSSRRTSRCRS